MTYLNSYSTKTTPQNEAVPGKNTVPNNAGGFAFAIDKWQRLHRFLILGGEGGTYYVGERKLTVDNASNVIACIEEDGARVVSTIVDVSNRGLAPKNDPALFALALCFTFGDVQTKHLAQDALPKVARIGTHLFHFAAYVNNMRGWGRLLRNSVADWYLEKSTKDLVYQVIKYQSRDGWSHADLLRLSHPRTEDPTRNVIFKWVVDGWQEDWHEASTGFIGTVGNVRNVNGKIISTITRAEPGVRSELYTLEAVEQLKSMTNSADVIDTIINFNLPREVIPTQWLNDTLVWEALLEKMPLTAMIRNLGKMTEVGLLTPLSAASKKIVSELDNIDHIKQARLHPLSILVALNTYAGGMGIRGHLTWSPVQQVVDALDGAFYSSFGTITPTGKNTMLALDVSGSMGGPELAGMPGISPRVGSAAMALVTANVENQYMITGFTNGTNYNAGIMPLKISPKQRLDDVVRYVSNLPFGGTDCALPMIYAMKNKLPVETFVIYTDSETWAGYIHPFQALKQYRDALGIPARLVVVGMTATEISIADPSDAGMMDVTGFSTDTPEVISMFSRGEI
jgi:60 kDa SS-A/Ro ribonucleoprotein